MRNFIFLLSFILSIPLNSQKVMSLLLPQNICIKSQDIWYGLYFHMDNLKEINFTTNPVFVQVALHDKNGVQYYRTQHKVNMPHLSSKFQLPANTKADSYVLSATIYNSDVSAILVETSTLLHVVDENSTQLAEIGQGNLKSCSSEDCNITTNSLMFINSGETKNLTANYHTRDKVCIETNALVSNNFLVSSNTQFNIPQGELYYQASSLANYQTLFSRPYTIKTTLPLGTGFFDVAEKKFYQLKKQAAPNLYLLQTDRTINVLHVQLLDILYNSLVDENPVVSYPTPIWKSATIGNFPYDAETRNNTVKKLESIFIVNGSVNPETISTNVNKAPQTTGSEMVPDESYIMANYQPFESVHLFLYEAVAPIKSIKKENAYDLRIVNLRTKQLFPDAPVILIDGKISDVENVYKLEYKDLKRMNIYRELNTTRSTFGSIAKNGVLEVITKKGLDLKKENFLKINSLSPSYDLNELSIINKQNIHIYPFVHFGKTSQNCIQHSDDTGSFLVKSYDAKGIRSFGYSVEL